MSDETPADQQPEAILRAHMGNVVANALIAVARQAAVDAVQAAAAPEEA